MMTRIFTRARTRSLVAWIIPLTLIGIVAALYRWSEPANVIPINNSSTSGKSGIVLRNAPFAAYSGGHKAWSLWAKSIELEHSQYASATSIQSAILTDIKDGVLYATSENQTILPLTSEPAVTSIAKMPVSTAILHNRPGAHTAPGPEPAPDAPLGPVLLRFHAKSGHYTLGTAQDLTGDLTSTYTSKWRLQLEGNVAVTTRDGDSLHTESLMIIDLTNIKTHKEEQRLECNSGATISRKDSKITANKLRYALNDHTVELLDGVRGTFRTGNIQTQRTFWILDQNIIQVPDPSAGTLNGNQFSASSLTMDLKNGTQSANSLRIIFRTDSEGRPIGLQMHESDFGAGKR